MFLTVMVIQVRGVTVLFRHVELFAGGYPGLLIGCSVHCSESSMYKHDSLRLLSTLLEKRCGHSTSQIKLPVVKMLLMLTCSKIDIQMHNNKTRS